MYEVLERNAQMPLFLLKDSSSEAEVELAPGRGGMVTRFRVGPTPVLFMDDATLFDPSKNVRGGIPILFPTAGPLREDRFLDEGRAYEMKQHGFARNLPWQVVDRSTDGAARLTLELASSDETLRRFPYAFQARFTYELEGARLRIRQAFTNRSARPLPLHTGFHPYLYVPEGEKAATRIETRATRAFDNVTKQEGPFEGFDLTRREVDLHLRDHGSSSSTLHRPDGPRIRIDASPEYTHWVVWTLAGRDFVCLEPWTAPAGALNTGDRLLWIDPGATRTLEVAVTGME